MRPSVMRLSLGRVRLAAVAMGLCAILPLTALEASPQVLTPHTTSALFALNNGPIFIAMEEGYFADQGIELRLTPLRDASQAWPALITGQLDVHTGAPAAAFAQAVLQGAKLRIVADRGHAGPEDRSISFVIRQDLIDSGRSRTLRDLRGMRIGLPSRAGLLEMFLLQILRNRALLTERDVHVELIPGPFLVDALRAKTIDAAAVLEPLVTRLESLGVARTAVTLHDVLPRAQYALLIYGPNLLVRNPGLGQRFMNAYLRGVQRYQAGKTDRNVAIIKKYTGDDEALLRKMSWPLIHLDGHVNVESLLQQQAWWVREGWVERAMRAQQFLDTRFARRAFQTLTATR